MQYRFRIREVDDGNFIAEYKKGFFGKWESSGIYTQEKYALKEIKRIKDKIRIELSEKEELKNINKKKITTYDWDDI